jgi:uncharacterized protein
MSDQPVAAGYRFACTHCGACCRGDWLTHHPHTKVANAWVRIDEADADRLCAHLGITEETLLGDYQWDGGGIEVTNGVCPFWDSDTHRCGVQPAKPRTCQDFPWPGIDYAFYARICPGLTKIEDE